MYILNAPAVKHFLTGSLYAPLSNNKWESFITPDTTRLNMMCGVTVCAYILHAHIPHCLFEVDSIYSTTVSFSNRFFFLPLYQDLHSGPNCKCREAERFSQGQPLFGGTIVDGGRKKSGAPV